ncbi:hypothetical protein ACC713_37880, partial [Rhizobium johnstonii]
TTDPDQFLTSEEADRLDLVDQPTGVFLQVADIELGAEKLGIKPAARQALIALIGGDRIASRKEVRKLALYCRGFDTVE